MKTINCERRLERVEYILDEREQKVRTLRRIGLFLAMATINWALMAFLIGRPQPPQTIEQYLLLLLLAVPVAALQFIMTFAFLKSADITED